MTEMVRCPRCHNVVGQMFPEFFVLRHKGRELIARQVLMVRCEKCGATWQPGAEQAERASAA